MSFIVTFVVVAAGLAVFAAVVAWLWHRERRQDLIALDDLTVGWVESGTWVQETDPDRREAAADAVRKMAADLRAEVGLPQLDVTTERLLDGGWSASPDVTRPGVGR